MKIKPGEYDDPNRIFLLTSAVLYFLSIYCLASKKNMIKKLIAIEIMVDASSLNFVALSALGTGINPMAHAIVITSIVIGGCVIAIGLAIVINAYVKHKTLDSTVQKELKW